MIRKIILFVFLIFTVAWFAIAYTIKNNVISIIKNSESDNIKVSYNVIKLSGYPFKWKISITEPKIKLIDHINSKEFSSENIVLTVDFSAKKAFVNLGSDVIEVENYGDKTLSYNLHANENIKGIVKFHKPLYGIAKGDSIKSVLKSIQFNNKLLSVSKDDKEIFKINDLAFFVSNKDLVDKNSDVGDNIFLLLNMNYESESNLLNFKNANLDIAASLKFGQDNGVAILKDFAIERFVFSCDNDSKIDLKGELQFFANRLPQGKLSFELENYSSIIDKLLPANIVFSKKIIKLIIAKAISKAPDKLLVIDPNNVDMVNNNTYGNIEKAKFDIEFSEKGINIGSINLLELQLGETNLEETAPNSN